MADLTRILSRVPAMRSPVVDRTGLTGAFDFELTFAPDGNVDSTGPVESAAPSLFVALPEQLGLKLESSKGPVEVLVIDSVERPTPN